MSGLTGGKVLRWWTLDGIPVPVAAWQRLGPGAWAEQVRPAVVFASDVLGELGAHDFSLGSCHEISLQAPGISAGC